MNVQDLLMIWLGLIAIGINLAMATGKTNISTTPSVQFKNKPLQVLYKWKQLDFNFDSDVQRNIAIASGNYIPENNLPLGLDVWRDKIFVTVPRWRNGVLATLSWVSKYSDDPSPKLQPYPSLQANAVNEACETLTSVFRIFVDECDRLWVLDSGQVETSTNPQQICPPSIFVFDLRTDQLLFKYDIPKQFIKEDSLYTNIVVDIRNKQCADAYVYATDVWRYGILVYELRTGNSWRLTHGFFFPDPIFTKYNLGNITFNWNDGIFGMALSPYDPFTKDRILFYHPMSSSREFFIKTSLIRNEAAFLASPNPVTALGQSRGARGHASASGMDREGVMFFNMVTRNSLACWDSSKPYRRDTVGIVYESDIDLVFPNDLKVDRDVQQNVWVLSNKLPFYLYAGLDFSEFNFRILTAPVRSLIKGTVCDPGLRVVYEHRKMGPLDCQDKGF